MKIKIYTTLLLFGTAASFFAQEKKFLTLDEAVRLGIGNSKNLKIDAAKVEEATADYLEAKNRQLPDFKITGSALALSNANVDLKILPPAMAGKSSAKASSAFYGNASLSLPIFTGGRIKYGIQSAQYLLEASKLSVENNKTAIAYNISQAYNNLFKAAQAIKILEENLNAAQVRDKAFLKLENSGILARNERLKSNLQTANIELQLLEARNNFNIAAINMDLLIGLPETTEIELDPAYINEDDVPQPVSYYIDQATQNRKDLQINEYQRKAAEIGVKAAKAEKLPSIALTAGYLAAEVPKILTVMNAANIGIGVQYNIDQFWKKDTSRMRAEAKLKEISAANELINDQIKLEINGDYQNAEFAKKKIAVLQKAADQAAENYQVIKRKYDNGLATTTELIDADAAMTVAKVNIINGKADAALAHRKLLQTAGILTSN